MKIQIIPKRNGKPRTIYMPSVEERAKLKGQVPIYAELAKAADRHGVQHGFTEGRSSVTNAQQHVGYAYTVSFDLADFFDTVTPDKAMPIIAEIWMGERRNLPSFAQSFSDRLARLKIDCFYQGAARQGLPTSPSIANLAAVFMDNLIMEKNNPGRFGKPPFVYTRYADDLTFSCNSFATVQWLLIEIPKIVVACGFMINPAKTKVQAAKAGRRIITGVGVGPDGIHPTREVKRRIRAAEHQKEHGFRPAGVRRLLRNRKAWKKNYPLRYRLHRQLDGLKEWAKLKPPKEAYHRDAPEQRPQIRHAMLGAPAKVEPMNEVGRYMRKL